MKDPYPPQKTGRILITGCPRSGTKFIHRYFSRQHKVFLGHECEGKHGTVEWRHAYARQPRFEVTISCVRHPLLTIRSLTDLMIAYSQQKDRIEWRWIVTLAKEGGWFQLLDGGMWVEAATMWWLTVYSHHRDKEWLQMRVEDFNMPSPPPDQHPKPNALEIDKDW